MVLRSTGYCFEEVCPAELNGAGAFGSYRPESNMPAIDGTR